MSTESPATEPGGEAAGASEAGPSLRAVQLGKWYGRITALQSVSFHLGPGIWGLLGPNGSGKSTLMGLAAGLLAPSLGEIRVGGRPPFGDPSARARVGLCPEQDRLPPELDALTWVGGLARLGGLSAESGRDRAAEVLERLRLRDVMERPMGTYSRGMRQRAKLAQALVHEPEVLLLDEPLSGTDPLSRGAILQEVRRVAERGGLVIFSTHVLPEVEAVTDQVVVLVRGQLVGQGRVLELREALEGHPRRVDVRSADPRALAAALLVVEGVQGAELLEGGWVRLRTEAPDLLYDTVTRLALQGHRIQSITSPDDSVEALFHLLVERASRMAGTGSDAAVGAAPHTRPGGSHG